jgi:hypothetical protein
MARVIKKTYFHSHCRMNDFSCHLRFPEAQSIIALNARFHCVSQWITPFNKDKSHDHLLLMRMRHMVAKNPNNFVKTNLIGKVKSLSLMGQISLR